MNSKSLFALLAATVLLSAILACNFGSSANPAPTKPSESPSQPAAQGVKVSFENASLVIPTGLGSGVNARKTDDIEYPPCANPSCVYPATAMPQHIVLTINGYTLAREARVAVFKASEYASIGEYFKGSISELQSLKSRPDVVPDSLTLPFAARVQLIAFQGGYGFRYLTQMNDGLGPISNEGLFYYFQGLTDDGIYFVMAVLPLSAPFLAATDDPSAPVPPGGVAFPDVNAGQAANIHEYLKAIADKMNATDPASFTPALTTLDQLIQSIRVGP